MDPPQALSPNLLAIKVTERVNSCISILGIAFILFTYIFYPTFRKPINRLIFFASWGNLGLNVAGLISIDSYLPAKNDALCKAQGFMVQMFLGVDVWWALCMAINVYLAFFRGRTISQLQALEVRYLLACYGLSFLPAFIFIFITNLYGEAGIWCSISDDYHWLRLVVLYAIIWVALLFSLVVYIFVGRVIWRKRLHLDGFLNPWNESPFTGTITTEIQITTESRNAFNDLTTEDPTTEADNGRYLINIESTVPKKSLTAINVRSITRDVAINETNPESWLYARAAFLFFIVLAITWIPASIFRIYDVVRPGSSPFPLAYLVSFLFPLQGFWNAVVYIITSRTACKEFWNSVRGRKRTSVDESMGNRRLSASYKRGKSGSFQTDKEELNPRGMMSKEEIRTNSKARLHVHNSQDSMPVISTHDTSTRNSAVEHSDVIELPGYGR